MRIVLDKVDTNRSGSPRRLAAMLIVTAMGVVSMLTLSGAISLPPSPPVALPLLLALVLYPGSVLALLLGWEPRTHPLARVAIASAAGLSVLTALGFIAILGRMTLGFLSTVAAAVYGAGVVAMIIMLLRRAETPARIEFRKAGAMILIGLAVVLALGTLVTPRDTDDWFYLAHIRDYVNGTPVYSEDAIFDNHQPPSPRAWYGGWWVAEAMLSRAAGVDPVDFHQVFLPVLLMPLAVLALFTLAKRVLRSERLAYLACFLQIVFYISSAMPSDSVGWAFLCRMAQDKTVACLIVVPVVIALALRLWDQMAGGPATEEAGPWWGPFILYGFCLTGATLTHPMAAVWCGVAIVPFVAIETIRSRNRRSAGTFLLVLLPFVLSGFILLEGRVATVSTLEGRDPGPYEGRGVSSFFEPQFPGSSGRPEAGDRVLALSDTLHMGHPLLITRYPLAILGLLLTFVLLRDVRHKDSARFLAVLTFSTLALTFVPGLASLTSAVVTKKMLYRLTWLLPWGLTMAFVFASILRRVRWAWLTAVLLALALCKGNPADYFSHLSKTRDTARAEPELVQALRALGREPAPQGLVLASNRTSLRIPGFVGEAYPVFYKSEGPRGQEEIRDLLTHGMLEGPVRDEIEALDIRYVLIRQTRSLARAFERGAPWVHEVYSNKDYGLWRTDSRRRPHKSP